MGKWKDKQAIKELKEEIKSDKQTLKELKNGTRDSVIHEGVMYTSDEAQTVTKNSLKTRKKTYRKQKKAFHQKHMTVKTATKYAIKGKAKQKANSYISQDETLAEVNAYKQRANQRSRMYRSLKAGGRATSRVGVKTGKTVYRFSNKTYNLIRGNGFYQQQTRFHDHYRKMQRMRYRLKNSRFSKGIHGTKKIVGTGIRVMHNPFKTSNLIRILGLLFPIVVVMYFFAPSIIKPSIVQNDRQLTDTYLALTKLDARNTSSANEFYTNWDDTLFYLNYRYDNFAPDSEAPLKDAVKSEEKRTFTEISESLWEALNGTSPYKMTLLNTVIKDSNSPWFLKHKDYKAFDEVRKQFGFTVLSNRFGKLYDTDSYTISKRMGYERQRDELKLNEQTEIKVNTGTVLYAPISGTIEEVGINQILINQENKVRVRITGMDTSRLSKGDRIQKEEYLGNAVKATLGLTYEMNQNGWYHVNPAFYLDGKVVYTQTTYLASTHFSPDAQKTARAKAIYDYFIKAGYTVEGISAMLGNFDVESNITPKRAEGDHLSPPIGANDNSWNDPSWLSIDGPTIYGKYPNILRRGLGLGQWTDTRDGSVRHTMLLDYAKAKNKNWYDLDLQLDFMLEGDTPSSVAILEGILSKKIGDSISELTIAFLEKWEGNPEDKVSERIQSAQNWHRYFTQANIPLSADSTDILNRYKDKMLIPYTDQEVKPGGGWEGNAYALGNCTWYVYNRMKQLGKTIHPYMGNANQWVYTYTQTEGASLVAQPQAGDIVIFGNAYYNGNTEYGHVAICEAVLEDGSFIVSEMNRQGEYSMDYRILQPTHGIYFMHVDQ